MAEHRAGAKARREQNAGRGPTGEGICHPEVKWLVIFNLMPMTLTILVHFGFPPKACPTHNLPSLVNSTTVYPVTQAASGMFSSILSPGESWSLRLPSTICFSPCAQSPPQSHPTPDTLSAEGDPRWRCSHSCPGQSRTCGPGYFTCHTADPIPTRQASHFPPYSPRGAPKHPPTHAKL
jgi:hypothetical protein